MSAPHPSTEHIEKDITRKERESSVSFLWNNNSSFCWSFFKVAHWICMSWKTNILISAIYTSLLTLESKTWAAFTETRDEANLYFETNPIRFQVLGLHSRNCGIRAGFLEISNSSLLRFYMNPKCIYKTFHFDFTWVCFDKIIGMVMMICFSADFFFEFMSHKLWQWSSL